MKNPRKYALQKLAKAVKRLSVGAAQAKSDLNKDGVIQRFEFSFELLWKTLKIFLEDKGVDGKTPKDSLKAAFRIGLIDDEEAFLDMLKDRNKMSHLYDEKESKKIFRRIKKSHLPAILKVLDRLEKELE